MSSPSHANATRSRWHRPVPQHVRHRSSRYRQEPAPKRPRLQRDVDSFLVYGLPALTLMIFLFVVSIPEGAQVAIAWDWRSVLGIVTG